VRTSSRDIAIGREVPAQRSRHMLLRLIKTFNRVVLALLATGLVVVLGYQLAVWLVNGPLFGLKYVAVEGNSRLSEADITGIMSVRPGCSLFRIKPADLADKLQEHCLVRSAHVRRRWPTTLMVAIEERHPVAAFEGNAGAVDEEGIYLPSCQVSPCPDLPVLVGVNPGSADYGDSLVQKEITWAVSLLRDMAKLKQRLPYALKQIDVRDFSHPLIYVRQCEIPLMVKDARGVSQLENLPYVLADVQHKKIEPEYIDVRFENQIIVKTKTTTDMGLESQAVKG